ncbi:MAG: hypothetical protein M5R36_06955 [Deltaproteobacteria bacterium]|nr:hypothetical protein [Deltaproteobacteria bacterium]
MEAYKEKNGTYTERLADLLEIDGSIADVDGVTFSFDHVSESGYRFSTHAPGSPATYRFTAKGVPFLPKLQARKKTADDDTADGDDASGGADASSDDAQMP